MTERDRGSVYSKCKYRVDSSRHFTKHLELIEGYPLEQTSMLSECRNALYLFNCWKTPNFSTTADRTTKTVSSATKTLHRPVPTICSQIAQTLTYNARCRCWNGHVLNGLQTSRNCVPVLHWSAIRKMANKELTLWLIFANEIESKVVN